MNITTNTKTTAQPILIGGVAIVATILVGGLIAAGLGFSTPLDAFAKNEKKAEAALENANTVSSEEAVEEEEIVADEVDDVIEEEVVEDTSHVVSEEQAADDVTPPVVTIESALSERPNPTCTITAEKYELAPGEALVVHWTTTGATRFSMNNGIGELTPTESGTVTIQPPLVTSPVYRGTAWAANDDVGIASTCLLPHEITVTTGAPTITVLSPNGGEVWRPGETHRISWSSYGVENVKIYIYNVNASAGQAVMYIRETPVAASDGHIEWTVPSLEQLPPYPSSAPESASFKAVVYSAEVTEVRDVSDGPFSILQDTERPDPVCTITANKYELYTDESVTITWTTERATKFSMNNGIGELAPVEGGSVTLEPPLLTSPVYRGTAWDANDDVGIASDCLLPKELVITERPASPLPDLVAHSILTHFAFNSTPKNVEFLVGNLGIPVTVPTVNRVRISRDSRGADAVELTSTMTEVPRTPNTTKGSVGPYTFVYDPSSTSYSIHAAAFFLEFCVDTEDVLDESREDNNCTTWDGLESGDDGSVWDGVEPGSYIKKEVIFVLGPEVFAGPVTPTTATINVPVTLTSTISNAGSMKTADTFTNKFQIATDDQGTGAQDIGTHAQASAISEWEDALNWQPTMPYPTAPATLSYTFDAPGTYYVRACADSNDDFAELIEFNNCGSWTPIVITETPQTAPACTLSVSPSSVDKGGTTTLSWTSERAESFSINNDIGDVATTSGSVTTPKLDNDVTYTGTVTNDEGETATCSTSVSINSGGGGGGGGGGGSRPRPKVLLSALPRAGEVAGSYIYLSQAPYTGLDLGPVGTIVYWAALVTWSLLLAYIVLFNGVPALRRRFALLGEQVEMALNNPRAAEPVRREPETIMYADTDEAPRDYSTFEGFKSFAKNETLSIEDIVKGLTRSHKIPTPEPVRNVEPIYEHVEPVEETVQEERVTAHEERETGVPTDVRGFTHALLVGDRAGVFAGLRQHVRGGGSAEELLSPTACLIDDAYRARVEGTHCDENIARQAARLSTEQLEQLASALATAIDSSYSAGVTGAKLALTRALNVLGA